MNIQKSTILMATASLLTLSASIQVQPAQAQDKAIELKIAHWVPASHPLQKAIEAWGNSLREATGGSVTYKVFPAQQLGKAFDHYDMARDGIADVTYVNPGYQPGRFPLIGAGEIPFLMKDAKGGTQAFDEWYRKYAAAEMKDVKVCMAFVHDPGAIHSKTKKVMVPEDIRGMKIRPANATIASFMTQLGATNVQSSAPEVRDILEKGVADAVTFPWGSVPLFGIDKVVKYHMDVPLYVTTFAWVMNKSVYEGMSAGQKTAVDAHCSNQWAVKISNDWADFEASGRVKLKAMTDREVYGLSPEQLALWRKAAEPLTAKWAGDVKKVGGDPDTALGELKAALAKYSAAY
jgi:TRAP-type transport system periplasmic protein